MPNAGLDTTRRIEVPPSAGVRRLLVTGVAVGVLIHRRCVADGVEVKRWVISAMRELFSEDKGMQFWPWIVEAAELPPWVESLLPAGMEMRLLAAQVDNSPKAHAFVDSDDKQDFKHFVWPQSCQGEGFGKA